MNAAPSAPDGPAVDLTAAELAAMLDSAGEKGARAALKAIGLEDEHAARDVDELRRLLEAWRSARVAVWQTVAKTLTTAVLAAIAAGAALHFTTGGR